jgi:hypothetical protein
MEATALDDCLWPTDGQSLEQAFLAVTDDVVGWWQQPEQFCPVLTTFVGYPDPGNDIAGSTGDETNLAANPDAVNNDGMMNLASQLVMRNDVPTPRGLVAKGPCWLVQFVLAGLTE